MVILMVIGAAAATAVVVGVSLRQWPASDPAAAMSASVGRELQDGGRMASLIRARLDPGTATGLALTVASIGVVLGGILTGVLLYVVKSHAGVLSVDTSIADWAAAHASSVSTAFLRLVTQLGSTPVVIAVVAATGVVEFRRLRSRSLWLFLLLVLGGELAVVNLIKLGVARARPAIDPLAPFSGTSFPSGHTATAAACYAALALVLSRGRTPGFRVNLAGTAAGIAVAVGCSRMLLGVHWFTDVLAGLAVGWAWFALCAIATGGRLLHFGAPAEMAPDPPRRRSQQPIG